MVEAKDPRDIPSGRNVARVFPWMAQGEYAPATLVDEGRFTILPRNESFKNKLDGPIEIHELRMLFANYYYSPQREGSWADMSANVRVKFNTSRDHYIEQWVPARSLANHPHDAFLKPRLGTRFRLPAPYFLQYAARFKIDLRLPPNMTDVGDREVMADTLVDVAIRGYDPDNKTPVVMNKQVTTPASLVAGPTTVSFDEEMDTALRHCVIDDISFGFVEPVADLALMEGMGPGGPPFHLDVRFHPNTGPEWVEGNDGWIRLSGVAGPPSMTQTNYTTGAVTYLPYIVHRPESPIVLKPKDELNVLVRREAGTLRTDERYYCWAIGTQEVP